MTGAAIGSLAGPLGAAVGATGGMIVGALTERAMHIDDARAETDPGAFAEPTRAWTCHLERPAPSA